MKKNWVIILTIIVLGFIVYTNSFQNKFLFDDIDQIVKNTAIRSFANLPAVFTHHLSYFGFGDKTSFFRPMQSLTLMVDHLLWGLEPFGYHITNTLLHILVSILLFYAALLVTRDKLVSAIISLLYLVHPVHTEAVTYVSGRADSLASIFLLLMIIFASRCWSAGKSARIFYYGLVMASLLLGLLSRESAIIFPFLLAFFEYCVRDKDGYDKFTARKTLFYLPLFVIIAAWLVYKNMITPVVSGGETPFNLRLIAAPRMIWDYIRLSFLPVGLHMEYRFPAPRSIFQNGYFGPLIILFIFLGAIYYFWKKGKTSSEHRIIFFGLGWFLIALLPYLNIFIEINALFAEHWLYVSEMGLVMAIVYFAFYCAGKNPGLRKITTSAFGIIIVVFSCMTIKQNAVWKDGFTFFTYTVKATPYSGTAYNNLALEYIAKGDRAKARELLEKAVKVDPAYTIASDNLENLKREMGR